MKVAELVINVLHVIRFTVDFLRTNLFWGHRLEIMFFRVFDHHASFWKAGRLGLLLRVG